MIFKADTLGQMYAADMPRLAGRRGFSVPHSRKGSILV